MSFSFLILIVVLLLAILQLAVGIVLGRYLSTRNSAPDVQTRRDAGRLREFADRLYEVATGMAEDVDQHRGDVRQAGEELALVNPDEKAELARSVLRTVAQIVRTSERLQSRLSAAEEQLHEQTEQIETQFTEARTDPLTGLANRRAFDDVLIRRIAEWHRRRVEFCLMMIDLDHFKKLNDRHGHPAGDHALRVVAEVLTRTFRQMDLIGRVGGEEFAVILPATTSVEGRRTAHRAREAMAAETIRIGEEEVRVTISLGLAATTLADDADSLMLRADEALYAAKHAGRNRGYFHNGEYCEPILPPPEEAPAPVLPTQETADPSDSDLHEAVELAAICEDLRDRLASITAGRTLPSNDDDDDRR